MAAEKTEQVSECESNNNDQSANRLIMREY